MPNVLKLKQTLRQKISGPYKKGRFPEEMTPDRDISDYGQSMNRFLRRKRVCGNQPDHVRAMFFLLLNLNGQ